MNHQEFREERLERRRFRDLGLRPAAASLILIGIIIGFSAALYYAWILEPVVFTEASPGRFTERYKEEYILLVSQSYAADGNWELAEARLEAMGDAGMEETVAAQLDTYLRRGEPASIVRNIARLAQRLGVNSRAIDLFIPQAANTAVANPVLDPVADSGTSELTEEILATPPNMTLEPTSTPMPTLTPTNRPSPTAVPVYRMLKREQLCLIDGPAPRIEVIVVDSLLEPQPGAEILVRWEGGSDRFFTGYQPDQGPGYADFGMNLDVIYSLEMVEGSLIVDNLKVMQCPEEEGGFPGGWRLTFQDTDVPQETPTPLFR